MEYKCQQMTLKVQDRPLPVSIIEISVTEFVKKKIIGGGKCLRSR